jgi:NADPH-dependent 2,4-dienoyl-CoA reductase/sulfur reductase-like enzyme
MVERVALAVVGAGPAGIAAAVTAAEAGVETFLVDAQPRPGGQYFKQPPDAFRREAASRHSPQADAALAQLSGSSVRVLSGALVWGAFPAEDGSGWELTLHGPGVPARLIARSLILATGAYDRPIPFPGWTLPGVMTAGGVQSFLKTQRLPPCRRFLLAGTGPLQIAVAAGLVQAGAEIVAILEAARLRLRDVRHAATLCGQWGRVAEGWDFGRTLFAARVPLRPGWAVVEARGNGQVEEAVICRVDDRGQPLPGTSETVAVDTIAIGYGLIPATELSRLLGCVHEFRTDQGGAVPRRDAEMQTSLPGVYAAGDGAGIGGAEMAQIEGRIAAFAAARRLGKLSETAARHAIDRERPGLMRQQRFARMLSELFTPGAGLYGLARDDTVVCRCEEVTLGEIRRAVGEGATSVNEIKGLTRTGMGNCQGRVCGELVARIIAAETTSHTGDAGAIVASAIESAGVFTARAPIHPLPLDALADTISD